MAPRPLLSPRFWLGLLLLLGPALAEDVRIARTSPEVRVVEPGRTVTHVFLLQGAGEVRVRFTSEHGWTLLTPERTLVLDPERPRPFPVTLRVPEDAPAGLRARLTVRAGGASAHAITEAAYRPGLEARWPGEVAFLPPLGRFDLEVANTGNGPDRARVRLETLQGVPVFQTSLPLGAGERQGVRIPVTRSGTLRVTVRLERGGLTREGYVLVQPPRRERDGAFQILGRLGAAYSHPGGPSFSLGAAGPLSDFVQFSIGAGYAPGGVPAGVVGFSWANGYLNAAFGPSYGVALGLFEGQTGIQVSLSGPPLRGNVNFDVTVHGHGFGASLLLDDDPSLRLYADLDAGTETRGTFHPGKFSASLTARPFHPELDGALAYGFAYRGWPVRLQAGFTGVRAAPLRFRVSADTNPERFGLGGRIAWTGVGVEDWQLAAASDSDRLDLALPLPVAFGVAAGPERFRAFADATLDLPAPWSNLRASAEARYRSGRWAFTFSGDSEATAPGGLTRFALGSRLGWPLEANELRLGLRLGGSYLQTRADLDWAPWKPRLKTSVAFELPAGNALFNFGVAHEWYGGVTTLGLDAQLPLVLDVPPAVTRFFGGHNVGVVEGEVRVEGPARLRGGVLVRAGGREARTDAAGRFRLELPPGEHTVEVVRGQLPVLLAPLEDRAQVKVQAKQTTHVRFLLAARSVLEGRVRALAEPGRELAPRRFAVQLEDARGRTTALLTEPGGAFTVPALAPGRYTVRLLTELLPPGWSAEEAVATVELPPGEAGRVELAVRPPARKVFTGDRVQILEVLPETSRIPPGAAPLVEVRLKGQPERVVVTFQGRLAGVLRPITEAEGRWRGRVQVPADASGSLTFQVEAMNGAVARFPFFLSASADAPWGVVRSLPVAQAGQTLEVAVHWYAPVEASWLEVEGERVELVGQGADWSGTLTVPEEASGRWRFTAKARLASGAEVALVRNLLIR